jgi:ankyrin repeat protein
MSEALQALYEGDLARARELLPPDAEPTIFEAAAFGRVERLREILAAEPSRVTALSVDGFTALHLAIFGGQREAARVLIEHGADVNQLSTSSIAQVPPLGTAAFVRSLPLARLLLDAGADVNGHEESGLTALHAAAENGDSDLARELLARGASRQIRTTEGKTAADLAANDDLRRLLAP